MANRLFFVQVSNFHVFVPTVHAMSIWRIEQSLCLSFYFFHRLKDIINGYIGLFSVCVFLIAAVLGV